MPSFRITGYAGLFIELLSLGLFHFAWGAEAIPSRLSGKYFDRAVIVIFENTNYSDAIRQPFFKQLAQSGANLTNMHGVTHPSQGNYIALTSGSTQGVRDDRVVDLDVSHIGDLLEAKGFSWKVYAEDYPGQCFAGKASGGYVRKHNPFVTYLNVQRNPRRCANIVNAREFKDDARLDRLPNVAFFIPSLKNSGHDTGAKYADSWYAREFSSLISDAKIMSDLAWITTFDESGLDANNQIYTSIVGPNVMAQDLSKPFSLYSLLRLIEDNFELGTLGLNDAKASTLTSIFRMLTGWQ